MFFAIVMQPLLDDFDYLLRIGLMDDIKVHEDFTICHWIFSDDVGMFIPTTKEALQEARDAITVYEVALGASLHLKKSVVILFGISDLPLWMVNPGCVISLLGMVQKYLGTPWGWDWMKHSCWIFALSESALGCRPGPPRPSLLLTGCFWFGMSYKWFRYIRWCSFISPRMLVYNLFGFSITLCADSTKMGEGGLHWWPRINFANLKNLGDWGLKTSKIRWLLYSANGQPGWWTSQNQNGPKYTKSIWSLLDGSRAIVLGGIFTHPKIGLCLDLLATLGIKNTHLDFGRPGSRFKRRWDCSFGWPRCRVDGE